METRNSHLGIPPWATDLGERSRAWTPPRGKRLLLQERACRPEDVLGVGIWASAPSRWEDGILFLKLSINQENRNPAKLCPPKSICAS